MILDIVGIIIIAYFIYSGMKKGLVKGIFSALSFLIALLLTVMTLNPVAEYVEDTDFGRSVYEKTAVVLTEKAEEEVEQGAEDEKNLLSGIIDTGGIAEEVAKIQENISESLGNLVIRALCAIALFIIYTLLIKIIAALLDAVAKLPILKTFNKIGGILAGAVNAYIFMIILCWVLTLLMSTGLKEALVSQLEESVIISRFYYNNPIL
ncbi:MAG: CvpA family protein [Clostridia bacterium]|nr:CvpA family protein [Clostridia bacterium]